MVQLALEIHDVDLLAARSDDLALVSGGPGYAVLDGDQLYLGEEAADRARLLPRRLADHFWQNLDGEPLGRPWKRNLTPADLAHSHLGKLWRSLARADFESVILAVPGSLTDQQLGFLLGITQALEMPVDGLVDLAVAAATDIPGDRLLHLDLHLHGLVVTELKRRGGQVKRRRVEAFEGVGRHALHDAWARRTADLCIRATRFDPFHSASSEQALYRELESWGRTLREVEELDVELEAKGKNYALTLERHEWMDAAEKIYRAFDDAVRFHQKRGERLVVLLAPSLADLPGIEASLARRRGVDIVLTERGGAARNALRVAEAIRQPADEGLSFVVTLPSSAALVISKPLPSLIAPPSFVEPSSTASEGPEETDRVDPPTSSSATAEPPPTHLLHRGVAWPIDDGLAVFERLIASSNGSGRILAQLLEPCCVVFEDGHLWFADGSSTWRINRELVVGRRALQVGDRLSHPSESSFDLQWIRVEPQTSAEED